MQTYKNNNYVTENQINTISIHKLQRNYKIGVHRATQIYNDLLGIGYIKTESPDQSAIMIQDPQIIWSYIETTYGLNSNGSISYNYMFSNSEQIQTIQSKTNSYDFDNMEGHEFEHFCAKILEKNGFVNVTVTQGSGDDGIDVLAERDGITYGIQCKCYSSNVGNSAVQQAYSGIQIYKCDIGVVLTNRYFTESAKRTAQATKIKLWDRDKLEEFVKNADLKYNTNSSPAESIIDANSIVVPTVEPNTIQPEHIVLNEPFENKLPPNPDILDDFVLNKSHPQKVIAKKSSKLSIIALIISAFGFGYISLIGALLAYIDISRDDDREKDHSRSIVAIIFFVAWIIFWIYIYSS